MPFEPLESPHVRSELAKHWRAMRKMNSAMARATWRAQKLNEALIKQMFDQAFSTLNFGLYDDHTP